jgi:hypothetical protein
MRLARVNDRFKGLQQESARQFSELNPYQGGAYELLFFFRGVMYLDHQFIDVNRFHEIIEESPLHSLNAAGGGAMSGQHDNFDGVLGVGRG